MKKYIFLMIFLLSLGMSTYAQIDSTTVDSTIVNITQAERIIDKYSAKATATVIDIVHSLGEPAKEVFNTVVKLQIAKGIFCLVLAIVGIGSLIFFIISTVRTDWYHDIIGFPLFMGLASGIAGFIALYWGLIQVLAPEWFAILELVNLIK